MKKEIKHTPGPWNVSYNGDGCVVQFENGPAVWDTTLDNEHSKKDVMELEANAHLITAAPELLEVCNHAIVELMRAYQMTKYLEMEDHKFGVALNELVMRLNEDLKTARAKAEGRE